MDQHGPFEKLECYEQPPFFKRRRNLVAFLSYLGFFIIYILRMNLNVAILDMETTDDMINEFQWDATMRGLVVCSFFLGYSATQLTGGLLSSKMGGVRLIGYSVLNTAILTMLTPMAARYSTNLLIFIRIVKGLFEGVVFPSIHAVWMRWAPPDELTHLGSIAFSGSFMGMAGGCIICGWLVNDYGWPYAFYVPGIIGIIWSIVWLVTIAESPMDDQHITVEELNYIINSIGLTDKEPDYPWLDFFTSKPLLAITCAHVCANWGNYTLLIHLPNYMSSFWHLDIKYSGVCSALPFIFLSITLSVVGFFADWLRKNKKLDTTSVRKLFCCSAFLSQTLFMYLTANATTPKYSIAYLSITLGLGAFAWAGFTVNHLDIGPQYANILMAISNTFATIPGVVSPVLFSYFRRTQGEEAWKTMFSITSGVFLFGAIFYGIFASGKRQPWAIVNTEERNTIIIRRSVS